MPELLSKEFIYKKGNARQLVSIIKNADENGLYAQGSRNADYAQNFLPGVLKTTREHFYTEFKSIIDESGT